MKKYLLITLITLSALVSSCGAGHEVENQYPFGYGPGWEVEHPAPDPNPEPRYDF